MSQTSSSNAASRWRTDSKSNRNISCAKMEFITVKTRVFQPPKDDFYDLLDSSLPRLREGDVLIITSKVLAIHQGRCLKIDPGVDKDKLIKLEADAFIPRKRVPKEYAILTLK